MNKIASMIFTLTLLVSGNVAQALVVYGVDNNSAKIDYTSPSSSIDTSVVYVAGASAVHLGNGWFITANHVNVNLENSVSINGNTANVSYINNSLNENYGVDLKLFYVENYANLDDLTSANLATSEVYNSLKATSFGAKGASVETAELVVNAGSSIRMAGAGFGRSDNSASALNDLIITSDHTRGTLRSGDATIRSIQQINGYDAFVTMAESELGYSQAQEGDSGGGFFAEFNDETYLIGIMWMISDPSSGTSITFGSYSDASLIISDGKISGVDTSAYNANNHTIALNLENYLSDINAIISSPPIPEPAVCAAILGLSALAFALLKRKNKLGK